MTTTTWSAKFGGLVEVDGSSTRGQFPEVNGAIPDIKVNNDQTYTLRTSFEDEERIWKTRDLSTVILIRASSPDKWDWPNTTAGSLTPPPKSRLVRELWVVSSLVPA
eukprot:Clim_evm100s109 gene=Clim_evmTU100s109